jgi:uncharacterized membrane protein
MNLSTILTVVLILLGFAVSIFFAQAMPEQMATHWNAGGQPDGHMPRFWALLFTPILMAMVAGLMYFFPKIDPLRKNVEKFRGHYENFIALMMGFLLLVHLQTVLWNAGTRIDPGITISFGLGLLLIYIGFMMGKAKRNWFIGIRTPWTLSSDEVWDKTHALGSKMFMAAGVIVAIGAFIPSYRFIFVILPVLVAAFVPAAYSYFVFRNLRPKA